MGGTKRVEGWNKILWMCNGGGGGGRTPPPWLRTCFYSEMSLGRTPDPPPRWRPEGLHRPPPELAPPFGAPLVLGQKSTSKKKRERGALDSAAFKLAPIQAGRAPPPRLAPMPPPCTPPPLPKGVARGVSRLPGTLPPPPPKKKIIGLHRPNWVKPRGERFGGQSTVVGPPP